MLARVEPEHQIGNEESCGTCNKYLLVHAEVACHGAAHQDARTDTDVPAAQVGAVCGAALVVAGEVHAHRLVTRENQAEACTDEERRRKECKRIVAEGENQICGNDNRHADSNKAREVAAVDQAPRHDAVQDKARSNQGVEPAASANAEFLRVKRNVVRHGAVGKTDEDEVHELRNGAGEEESVKRKRRVRLLFAGLHLEICNKDETYDAQNDGSGEDDVFAETFVEEHARHGARGKRKVHAHAEVSDALAAAACRERVDGDGVACGCGNSEEEPVRKTQHRQKRNQPENLVPEEACGEQEERPKIKRLAAERIDEEPGERAAGEGAHGVHRNHDAHFGIACIELVEKIKRQHREQKVETEKEQKVRCGHHHEGARPKFWKLRFVGNSCILHPGPAINKEMKKTCEG